MNKSELQRARSTAAAGTRPLVRLAGSIALERGDLIVSERDLPGRQLRAAFVFLVIGRGRPITHEELAEALWPEGPPATWQAALRGVVSKVRGFLDAGAIGGAAALVGEAGRYRLDLPPDAVVDVEQAEAAVEQAAAALDDGSIEQARALASDARAVLTQPLLPGIDAPWLSRWRDELRVAHVRALGVLGTCRLRAGEHGDARTVFQEIVRYDPFDEVAWRGLMEVHAAAGRTAKALAVYEELRDLLADELGVDPSPATRELHLRLLRGEQVADDEPVAPTDVAPAVQAALEKVPYRGLEHFREQDADLFFGREPDVQRLVGMLGRHRFVAVVGSSGSGKSSLVRAGLLPTLARGALPDADTWAYATLVPGHDPLQSLSGALANVWPNMDRRLLVDRLRVEPAALDETVARLLAGASTGRRLLLVVDQFEELFALTRDAGAREAFIDALLDAARSAAGRILVVLTMRADFVARAAEHVRLAEALTTSQFVLGPLDPDGVERAIEGPLRRVGARFEDGLVARILTEVVGEPGALPLLQHALLELWTRRTEDGVLTRQAYEEIGGVAGALARRAETTYAGFDRDRRTLVRRVLLRLTEPGEGTDDTRRRVTMTELSGIGDPDEVEEVVRALADSRLLTTGVDHDGVRTIEVAHEALIRGWPRLAGWIDDDREGLRLHRRLTVASRDWDRAERDEDLLWRGGRLAAAVPWAEQHLDDLDDLEAAFLRASREAEEQALRRRRRLQRTLLSAAIGATAVLSVLALIAVGARNDAEEEARIAVARELAAASVANLEVDPERSILLAVEAVDATRSADGSVLPEVEEALHRAVVASRIELSVTGVGGAVDWSPRGVFVTEGPDESGLIDIRNASTGKSVRSFKGHDIDVNDVVFNQDGSRLATVGDDGKLKLWNPKTGRLLSTWSGKGSVWGPSFSASGARLAASWTEEDTVQIVDAVGGRVITTLHMKDPIDTAFSPDGRRLAVTSREQLEVSVFDVETGRRAFDLPGDQLPVDAVAWSPDGRFIATAGNGTSGRVWEAATGRLLFTLSAHTGNVFSVDWSPDSNRLVTGGLDGVAIVWEITEEEGREVLRLSAQGTRSGAIAAFSPDGERVITGAVGILGGTTIWDISVSGDAEWANFPVQVQGLWLAGVEFSPDGRRVVATDATDSVSIWELATGRKLRSIPARGAASDGSTFEKFDVSADGKLIATAGFDGTARVWDASTGKQRFVVGHDGGALDSTARAAQVRSGVAWSADGRYLVASSPQGGTTKIVDSSGRLVRVLREDDQWLFSDADISADGRMVMTLSRPARINPAAVVKVWERGSGDLVTTIKTNAHEVTFDPSGTRIATGDYRGLAQIWDAATGDNLTKLAGHAGPIMDIAFSDDGSSIATASIDGTIRLWDPESGLQRLLLRAHEISASGVDFSPDGTKLASVGGDGVARVWALDLDDLLRIARDEVTRPLTDEECRQYLRLDACPS